MIDIAVAMTTYNGLPYLEAQLASILNQTSKPKEIVICDDQSTDGTWAFLQGYARQEGIRVYRNQTTLGVANNFKKAVSLCTPGCYIALADQDDVWLPEKLETSSHFLRQIDDGDKPALVFSDLELVDASMEPILPSFWGLFNIKMAQESLKSLLFGNFVTGCTILMNAAMARCFANMPNHTPALHDHWLALIAYSFGNYYPIAKPLIRYRQHGKNVTYRTNKRKTLIRKLHENLQQLFNSDTYFQSEIETAKQFMAVYGHYLDEEHRALFARFIALEGSGYWAKKQAARRSHAYRRT